MTLGQGARPKLLSYLTGKKLPFPNDEKRLIGVLPGCGIGPEVINSALQVLAALQSVQPLNIEVECGGAIGEEAEAKWGRGLANPVIEFCSDVFARAGVILNGPGGGRYVYDLRRQFSLFCKFVPVTSCTALSQHFQIGRRPITNVNMLIVRDNAGGVYQGTWSDNSTAGGREVQHSFSYNEAQVKPLVEIAARAAADRQGKFHLIIKDGGVPGITALWRELAAAAASRHNVRCEAMNIDLAAYELVRNPTRFDVVVAPNLFGDVLADIAGLLCGGRGTTFSGNFDPFGRGVYQTNHGCAHDLAGTDTANPAGQILSLAMLLRESFGLEAAAGLIEEGLTAAWQQGWRTADIEEPGCRVIGTREMADRVTEEVLRLCEAPQLA